MWTSVALALSLCVALGARAQPSATIDAGFYSTEGIQMFFVGDLGLTGGATPPIFWIRMTNPDADTHMVAVSLRIEDGDGQVLASGRTRPFPLEPGVREITNQDLLSIGGQYKLEDYEISETAQELVEKVLVTGKLPAGIYRFILSIEDLTASGFHEDFVQANITNPTTIDLVSPGAPVGEGELPVIYTTYPLFRWESSATHFRVTIAERSGAPGETPESAIENNVRFEREVYVQRNGTTLPTDLPPDAIISPGPFFQYPTAGVLPLLEDSTYYWRVVALVPTSSDPEHPLEITSPIWGFHIARISPSESELMWSQITNWLQGALMSDQFSTFFGSGGALEGYHPTGVVLLNGRRITMDELQQMFSDFSSGRLRITSVTVE